MKPGKTFVEKILNAPAGSIVLREPDMIMSHDNSAHIRKIFERMGGERLNDASKLLVVLDRKMTGTTDELIRDYNSIHCFMEEQQVEHFFDCDKGICHEVLTNYLRPGMLVVGNDSHTCTAGAFDCLAVGLNKTETAALWKTGKMWFRVPQTVKIVLKHSFPPGVYAKDLALWVMGMLRDENVAYTAIEYHGEGVHSLSVADRMTIANVTAEMGVKNAVFPPDDRLADYFGDYALPGVWADENAAYYKVFEVDLAHLAPLVMEVSQENEIKAAGEWGKLEMQQGLIGGCANGRLEDLRIVARILEGKRIAPGFQLAIVPASREIYLKAIEEGIIDVISRAGASVLGASCGPCLGSSHMIQADTRRFITTVNSNSMRRLSAIGVEKYVASPATVAMTALSGKLTAETGESDSVYPYWKLPEVQNMVGEFEDRYANGVWNYSDINRITCEQLFAEQWTYHIEPENIRGIQAHLLEGLDVSFAKRVKEGDIILGGEDFGYGKLNKYAVTGLWKAGVRGIVVRSADRRFFRMALQHHLWVVIAPEIVAKYKRGDALFFSPREGRIFLNKEEFILPEMDINVVAEVDQY